MLTDAQKAQYAKDGFIVIPGFKTAQEIAALRARFADTDAQFKGRLALEKGLNPDPNDPTYIVTVNLVTI